MKLKKWLPLFTAALLGMTACRPSTAPGPTDAPDPTLPAVTDNEDVYVVPELAENVAAQAVYYVSPTGSDGNDGTQSSPFYTVQYALQAVEKYKKSVDADMDIVLMEGDTYLHETLKITPAHSLPGNHVLTIRGEKGKNATLNGGRPVKNWKPVTVNGRNMYRALITDEDAVRMFTVEGDYRPLATKYFERDQATYKLNSRASWEWGEKDKSIRITREDAELSGIQNPSQLEIAMICEWKTFVFKTDSIEGKDTVKLLQPYAGWYTTPATVGKLDPGGHWFPNPKHPLWLQNDVSLIDTRGEWCFDKAEKMLYYYPMEGEDPNESKCVAAKLDTVIAVQGGKDANNKFGVVKNVTIRDLAITGGTFDQLEEQGIGVVQGQEYYSGPTETQGSVGDNTVQPTPSESYRGNIWVTCAKNVQIQNCRIFGMAKSAVHIDAGSQECGVHGNEFRNLGDSAVVVSNPHNISAGVDSQVVDVTVDNNLIRSVSKVNLSAPAIYGYYATNLSILHNDVYDAPQAGIALGWGWYIMDLVHVGDHNVAYNKVGFTGHTVRDGGPIYVLGRSRDNRMYGNYVYDQRSAYAGLYLDEGSCGWTVTGNLVDNLWANYDDITWYRLNGFAGGPGGSTTVYHNILRGNYTTNAAEANHGNTSKEFGNVLEHNTVLSGTAKESWPSANPSWPQAAKDIFAKAGLEKTDTRNP